VVVCHSVSQSVAVRCSVLQCVAVCCSALQCVAECCSVLHSFWSECVFVRHNPRTQTKKHPLACVCVYVCVCVSALVCERVGGCVRACARCVVCAYLGRLTDL